MLINKRLSYESIIVARKPNDSTFAANALKWGVSGLNIDGVRVESGKDYTDGGFGKRYGASSMPNMGNHQTRPWVQEAIKNGQPVKDSKPHPKGRFPANLILSHSADCVDGQCGVGCAVRLLDADSGEEKTCTISCT